ncbi:MAG: MoaD/ThiS family protein [Chloroflexota bacterium]
MGKIELHLYGELRKYTGQTAYNQDSIAEVEISEGSTVADALGTLGVGTELVGLAFVNGQLSRPSRQVADGDRVGVFPPSMRLLYKWYFDEKT